MHKVRNEILKKDQKNHIHKESSQILLNSHFTK